MHSPQLVLVARAFDEHVQALHAAAQQRGVHVEFLTGTAEEVAERVESLENVMILWRSSPLPSRRRTDILRRAQSRGCQILNEALVRTPRVREKSYQQQRAKEVKLPGIPTYAASDVLRMTFPVIAKPNIGSQGKGILLLKTKEEFNQIPKEEAGKYVYQSFIPNDGDYRVIMIGGVPLGVMKRIGKEGEYRNNISQGGRGELVTDPEEHAAAIHLAAKVAAAFGLQMCGVDLIRHAETGARFFLEVNTVPEWNGPGFQYVTGVDVAAKAMEYVEALVTQKEKPLHEVIAHWYGSSMPFLSKSIAFHWWSRVYLWTHDADARAHLEDLRGEVFGDDIVAHFRSTLAREHTMGDAFPAERKAVLNQYPHLLQIQSVLAKTLFAQTIYGEDVRQEAMDVIGEETLRSLWQTLCDRPKDLLTLSTYALNTLSFLSALYGEAYGFALDPRFLLDTLHDGIAEGHRDRDLIYFATHAIIGASQFYAAPIMHSRDVYGEMLEIVERIVREGRASLDAEIECVVASVLLNRPSPLREHMMARAERSRAPQGVYLSDPSKPQGGNIFKAEHRNVLFVMANTQWIHTDARQGH